jgi:undecaprenyl-diphosphatase
MAQVSGSSVDASRSALSWLTLLVVAGVGGAAVIALASVSAEIYDGVTEGEEIATLDRPVLDAMVQIRSPGLNEAVNAYTSLGGVVLMPLIVTVAAAALCGWWRSWTPAVIMGIGALGSVLMTVAGKELVGRLRPPQALAVRRTSRRRPSRVVMP